MLSSEGKHRIDVKHSKYGRPLVKYDRDNYHLIFDNGIGYNLSCKICETLAHLGILNPDYVKIRMFRGDMTLRISPSVLLEGVKPYPKVIGWLDNPYTERRDGYIYDYLTVLEATKRLFVVAPSLTVP